MKKLKGYIKIILLGFCVLNSKMATSQNITKKEGAKLLAKVFGKINNPNNLYVKAKCTHASEPKINDDDSANYEVEYVKSKEYVYKKDLEGEAFLNTNDSNWVAINHNEQIIKVNKLKTIDNSQFLMSKNFKTNDFISFLDNCTQVILNKINDTVSVLNLVSDKFMIQGLPAKYFYTLKFNSKSNNPILLSYSYNIEKQLSKEEYEQYKEDQEFAQILSKTETGYNIKRSQSYTLSFEQCTANVPQNITCLKWDDLFEKNAAELKLVDKYKNYDLIN